MMRIPPSKPVTRIGLIAIAAVTALVVARTGGAHKNPAAAQQPATTAAAAPVTAQTLTAADVETFFDGMIPPMLEHGNIAGGVVIIVKDGNVLFSKGYGYADLKTKKPVLVDETLFRPGSVSKLFTATAVMQLVERGKLDLDRDVNDYIDFKIPATYPQPVTLRRIMTHTAGFEEWGKDLFVPEARELEPLGQDLQNHLPARIFPPGTMPAYSNYAVTLEGYIVQRVSGEKFEDYIANHIFAPLGMTHSSFAQPLPDNLKPLMSSGYSLASAGAKPFEYVNGAPAGALSTSAGDIAHFMLAHLQNGTYSDVQILQPATAQLMHSRAFGPVPQLNGMALQFFQEDQNSHTVIGHGGDTRWFHSHLSLILDANTGFFISLNSAGRGDTDIRGIVFKKFLDRYFPAEPPLPPALGTAKQDAQSVAGDYITSRRNETSFLKLQAMQGEAHYAANSDGTLSAPQSLASNGQPRRFREIAPMVFRDMRSEVKIAFKRTADGRFDIFTSGAATGFQQIPFTQSTAFIMFLFYFGLIVTALTILGWPASTLIRWHYGRKLEITGADRKWRLLTWLACALDVLLILGWINYLNRLGPATLDKTLDPLLDALHAAGWLGVMGTAIVCLSALRSLFFGNLWAGTRFWNLVTALGCIALTWLAWASNLLKFSTKF
jgi:CubicO group peptidase (beta-lactamase class C family)